MSLTTVSSASFLNLNNIPVPRVFGLGRGGSPPPSPHTRARQPSNSRHVSSSPRKRPSPPPRRTGQTSSPPPTRTRSPARKRRSTAQMRSSSPNRARRSSPPRPPTTQPRPAWARIRSRSQIMQRAQRAPTVSTISTLSSLISTVPPPPSDAPPPRSLAAALRALEKLKISNTDRVEGWRVVVATSTEAESGTAGAAGTTNTGTTVASGTAENVETAPARDTSVAESQDLTSLSDEVIFALTQNIKNEEASRRPLVAPIAPLAELRGEFCPLADAIGQAGGTGTGTAEYAGPNANVLRKIDWLQKHGGWSGIRRTRGDGDCFYRSLAFAYVEKIMSAAEPGLAVATSLSHLESTLPLLEQAGFQRIVFEDFYECFAELIQQIVPPTGKPPLTHEGLLEQFQNPEISNSIVVFLRLLTSSYIRLSPEDDFTPFLFHPDTGEMIDVRTFVEMFVEATGREADHPQIMALSKALRVRIEVAYLDNSAGTPLADGTVRVDFVQFSPEGSEEDGTKPVVLLYRPGHYDTLEEKVEG